MASSSNGTINEGKELLPPVSPPSYPSPAEEVGATMEESKAASMRREICTPLTDAERVMMFAIMNTAMPLPDIRTDMWSRFLPAAIVTYPRGIASETGNDHDDDLSGLEEDGAHDSDNDELPDLPDLIDDDGNVHNNSGTFFSNLYPRPPSEGPLFDISHMHAAMPRPDFALPKWIDIPERAGRVTGILGDINKQKTEAEVGIPGLEYDSQPEVTYDDVLRAQSDAVLDDMSKEQIQQCLVRFAEFERGGMIIPHWLRGCSTNKSMLTTINKFLCKFKIGFLEPPVELACSKNQMTIGYKSPHGIPSGVSFKQFIHLQLVLIPELENFAPGLLPMVIDYYGDECKIVSITNKSKNNVVYSVPGVGMSYSISSGESTYKEIRIPNALQTNYHQIEHAVLLCVYINNGYHHLRLFRFNGYLYVTGKGWNDKMCVWVEPGSLSGPLKEGEHIKLVIKDSSPPDTTISYER